MSLVSYPGTLGPSASRVGPALSASDIYKEAGALVLEGDPLAMRAYGLGPNSSVSQLSSRFRADPGALLAMLRGDSRQSVASAPPVDAMGFRGNMSHYARAGFGQESSGIAGNVFASSLPAGQVSPGTAKALLELVDPEPALDYTAYWQNLHAAVKPMPPLTARHVNTNNLRFLPFSGFSEDSISLATQTGTRYAPTPYAFNQPGVHAEGVANSGLCGPGTFGTLAQALETPCTAGAAQFTGAGQATGISNLSAITSTTYMNTTMTDEGYSSLYGSLNMDKFALSLSAAEFSGGFCLCKVTTGNGAVSRTSIAGQNQTRGLGLHSLHQDQYISSVSSTPGTYTNTVDSILKQTNNKAFASNTDFEFNANCGTLGLLQEVVDYDEVVSGADQTVVRFYAIPILPTGPNIQMLTPAAAGDQYTAAASIWMQDVSMYSEYPSGTGNLGLSADQFTATAMLAPNSDRARAPFAFEVTGLAPVAGDFLYWSSVNATRICRCAKNLGQSLLAGMPQFECMRTDAAAGGSVTIQLSQKLFFNMVTTPSDPTWSIARPIGKQTSTLTEKMRGVCACAGGRGNSAAAAVRDSKNNTAAVGRQLGQHQAIISVAQKAADVVDDHPAKPSLFGLGIPESFLNGSVLKSIGGAGKYLFNHPAGRAIIDKWAPTAVQHGVSGVTRAITSGMGEAAGETAGEIATDIGEGLLAFLAAA